MGKISTSGLEELIGDMEAIAEIPDDTILKMLTAEAEILAKAQEQQAKTMGVYDTGTTAMSIKYGKKLKKDGSEKFIHVYPQGTRNDGNKRRVAEVAFINEFGSKSKGMTARPFINTANEKSADAAVEAAARVYDEFLKSKNL